MSLGLVFILHPLQKIKLMPS
nr:unnamed protein product [Callosobruchus analis]CAI5850530.1 unnamed protein product [Callosobruchus analis]